MKIKVLEEKYLKDLKKLYEICFDIECNINIMESQYKNIKNKLDVMQLILLCDEKVIGHIKYDLIYDIFGSGKKYMYLSDLCIHPDYRGNGYSKLLMNYCEEEAKDNDCKYIFLNSSEFRKTAHKLYNSLGYSIRDSRIYKKVI